MKVSLSNYLFLFLFSAFIISCSEQKEEHKTTLEESSFDDVLRDDDGKAWKVQHSTDSLIGEMTKETMIFEESNPFTSYASLKKKLNQDFIEIFDRCTMTGEGHNQLHNYLIPLRNRIRTINDTLEGNNRAVIIDIQNYLFEFNKYFEP